MKRLYYLKTIILNNKMYKIIIIFFLLNFSFEYVPDGCICLDGNSENNEYITNNIVNVKNLIVDVRVI